jgi:uncharacterized membrane protein YphA (DoxX/SURF4 family)
MNKIQIGKLILRYSLIAVFTWFGVSQLSNPNMWTSMVPDWATSISGMTAPTIILLNGIAEVILSILLAIDIFTPIVSILLALHLFIITFSFGASPVGVRDFGLSFAMLAFGFLSWDDKKTNNDIE